jgi:hypothetical protein
VRLENSKSGPDICGDIRSQPDDLSCDLFSYDLFSLRSFFEPQSLAVQPVTPDIENAVVSRAKVFQCGGRSEFDELFLGKMLSQVGIQVIIQVRSSVGHRIRHAPQCNFGGRESRDAPFADGRYFFIAQAVHSASGRIGSDSKWAPDPYSGAQGQQHEKIGAMVGQAETLRHVLDRTRSQGHGPLLPL